MCIPNSGCQYHLKQSTVWLFSKAFVELSAMAEFKIIVNEEVLLTETDLVLAFLACQAQFLEQNLFLKILRGVLSTECTQGFATHVAPLLCFRAWEYRIKYKVQTLT